jgi:hypothetical protein
MSKRGKVTGWIRENYEMLPVIQGFAHKKRENETNFS